MVEVTAEEEEEEVTSEEEEETSILSSAAKTLQHCIDNKLVTKTSISGFHSRQILDPADCEAGRC